MPSLSAPSAKKRSASANDEMPPAALIFSVSGEASRISATSLNVAPPALQVSIELAQLHSALLNLPVVRSKLYDATVPAEARIKLLYSLIGNADFNVVTKRLAEHATCNLRNRRYLQTIQWLINKFSRHMGESMVTVTTATPLSKEQVKKLVAIYSAKTGHPVHINSVVDPTVLGGMRIQVGDEVTDNTVVAQLQHLQRTVKATA